MIFLVNGSDIYFLAQLWLKLCDLISNNPSAAGHLDVDAIIRQGLAKFTDQVAYLSILGSNVDPTLHHAHTIFSKVGRLWTSLANYYIRLGNFEKARDIFEEGLNGVMTVLSSHYASHLVLVRFETLCKFGRRIFNLRMD